MKYLYLLLANLAAFAIAGHFKWELLPLATLAFDIAIWSYWVRQR